MQEENEILIKDHGAEEAEDWNETPEDDMNTPAFTIRAIILGLLFSTFLSLANTLFSFRKNSFRLPISAVMLISYPIGQFFSLLLPSVKFFGLDLNPGDFSMKEHVLITLMAAAAGGRPTAIENIVIQSSDIYLGDQRVNVWNSLTWVLVTQLVGFGLSGLLRGTS